MLNIIKNTINRVFASGVDSDASAFITATGLSGTTQKSAITTLVKDLKSSGLWSKIKAVYPMVTDNYNLLSYTEDFANAAWLNDQASSTANQTIAPNGTNTADKLIENSANNHHLNYQSVSATVGQIYTFSVYLKAAERSYAAIQVADSIVPVNRYTVLVDLINGTILGTRNSNFPTNTSSSIQSVGNGWYRVTATMKQVAGTSFFGHIATSNSSTPTYDTIDFPTYTGNGTSGIFIWGAQIELASSASTYQPILTTPAAYMASQMKYNLKDARDLDAAFRLTWSGGWTYSATGAKGNGTNGYANTNLNSLSNLSETSTSLSIYSRTNNTVNAHDISSREFVSYSYPFGVLSNFGGTTYSVWNDYLATTTGVNTSAYFIQTKNSSTVKLFRNNSPIITATKTLAQMPNANVIIGAAQDATVNGYAAFSNREYAFATIGNGLSDQDTLLLNQIVEKYQVALSRGVQAAQSFYYNSAYSNESNTYLYSTQITGTTQVSAINTLINGLKANNLWTKMKAVYPFVTDKINLLSYTEDFTNAVWTNNNLTISANSTNSPINTLTADTLTPTTSNVLHFVQSAIVYSAGNQVLSVYAKSNGYNFVAIGENNGSAWAYFNLSNGTVGNTNNAVSTSIENVGNGWYRCSLTYASSGGTKGAFILCDSVNGNLSAFAGNGTNGIYLWGAQLELGSTASTYQPVLAANNYATNVAAQMKFNLVNPQDTDAAFRLAFSGGWTYSTNGAQPNGTNGFADTKLVPNTDLTLNNSSFSIYSRTAFTPLTNQSWGVTSSGSFLPIIGATIDTTTRINGFSYSYMSPDVMNSATGLNFAAMFLLSRTSATSAKLFRNITQLASTSTQGQVSQPTTTFTFGALRNSASFQDYNNFQYGFAHISNGLSDAEIIIFYQLVQQFQTNLTRQV
jgi:hypothetical protein